MRTRIKTRGEKIFRCTGRKLVRYAIMMCAVVFMASCGNAAESEEWTSWDAYCLKYGVDKVNPSDEQENFYADCYMGSAEEEYDLEQGFVEWISEFDIRKIKGMKPRDGFIEVSYYEPKWKCGVTEINVSLETAAYILEAEKTGEQLPKRMVGVCNMYEFVKQ